MTRLRALLVAALLACSVLRDARAAGEPDALFEEGVRALQAGAYDQAVRQFERLDDTGFTHPDASYNRAIAYMGRASSPQAASGDLGRATAALVETLSLRPGDADADGALDAVHAELGRRSAGRAREQMLSDESFGRAIVGLLSEDTWSLLAALGSLSLSVGLGLALWGRGAHTRVPSLLASGVGGGLLLITGACAAFAHHTRVTEARGVVVAPEARLLDERAVPITGEKPATVPEGAIVRVTEQRAALLRIAWGRFDGWVLRNQLRIIRQP